MQITLSTQKLVPLIEDLSQSITAIATYLKDAETAADAETPTATPETKTKPSKSQKPSQAQSKKKAESEAEPSGDVSSEKSDVTIEDVRAVLAEKTQDGLTAKVRELLESFDAKKLSLVDPERLPELLEAAKALK